MPLMNRTGGTTGALFVDNIEPPGALDGDLWSDTSNGIVKVKVSGSFTNIAADPFGAAITLG